jgi:hypothetical protein
MELNDKAFRQKPEFLRGRSGERVVAKMFQRAGWYIIPSYDYCGDEKNKAPKLMGFAASHVIPDLDISRKGTRRWVEVKTKKEATFYRKKSRYEHGINYRHYLNYLEVQLITGDPVFLCIYEEETQQFLIAALDELRSDARIYDGPNYKDGECSAMIFFPRSAFHLYLQEEPDAKAK